LAGLVLLCQIGPVYACSFVDLQAAIANSLRIASYYWIASGILGGLIVGIALVQRRFSWVLVPTAGLVVFHPRWTITPFHGPDCSFLIVEVSQFVLAALCLLLGYEILKIARRHGKSA